MGWVVDFGIVVVVFRLWRFSGGGDSVFGEVLCV